MGETLNQFPDAHERAFEYFGGHTREHLTIGRGPSATRPARGGSSGTRQFADYWGFGPHVCQAYRAQTTFVWTKEPADIIKNALRRAQ